MRTARARQLGLLSTGAAAIAVTLSARYAFSPLEEVASLTTALAEPRVITNDFANDLELEVPAAALATTLRDDLFPDPPPPPPERPPPRLDLELVAIFGAGEGQTAFLFEPGKDAYHELAPGDEAPGGAVLAALDSASAVFDLAGREVRLELRP